MVKRIACRRTADVNRALINMISQVNFARPWDMSTASVSAANQSVGLNHSRTSEQRLTALGLAPLQVRLRFRLSVGQNCALFLIHF